MIRARAHDVGARDELVRRLRPKLLDRIEIMMGTLARRYAESSDVAQSVIVEVLRDLDRFEPRQRGSLLRWACRIARNHIHDEVRRKHERAFESLSADSQDLLTSRGPTASTEVSFEEQKERLADALLELAPDHREVVRLRFFAGLTFGAIGEQMGRSENAVGLLHSKALLRLGALLRELADESGS